MSDNDEPGLAFVAANSQPDEIACWKKFPIVLCVHALGLLVMSLNLMGFASTASADEVHLPPINLGDTSFEDGIGFPGWMAEEIVGYYYAGQVNDNNGEKIPGSNKFITLSATTHIVYLSRLRWLGAWYGAEFLIPLADVESDANPGQNHLGYQAPEASSRGRLRGRILARGRG